MTILSQQPLPDLYQCCCSLTIIHRRQEFAWPASTTKERKTRQERRIVLAIRKYITCPRRLLQLPIHPPSIVPPPTYHKSPSWSRSSVSIFGAVTLCKSDADSLHHSPSLLIPDSIRCIGGFLCHMCAPLCPHRLFRIVEPHDCIRNLFYLHLETD